MAYSGRVKHIDRPEQASKTGGMGKEVALNVIHDDAVMQGE